MIPRNEEELELYFLLQELLEAKRKDELPWNMKYPQADFYQRDFKKKKAEYLMRLKERDKDKL